MTVSAGLSFAPSGPLISSRFSGVGNHTLAGLAEVVCAVVGIDHVADRALRRVPPMVKRSPLGSSPSLTMRSGASPNDSFPAGATPIVQLGAEPSGNVFAIGGTRQSCSYRYVAYANDGTVTASTNSPVDAWFSTPSDRDEINGPGETKATPVKGHVVGLAPLDLSRALVMCDNGAAMRAAIRARHGGRSPGSPTRSPSTADSGRYWVAGAQEGCDGVTVHSLTEKSGSLTRGGTRCAAGLEVAAGQVAFDVTGDGTIWLWSGSRVVISRDDGQTWK